MKSHTSGKMSIGKKIRWVYTLLSSSMAWQVFTFRRIFFWLGKYDHEEERKKIPTFGWVYFSFCWMLDCSRESVSKRAGSSQCWWQKKVTNAEKHPHFFRAVTKLWLSRFGSRRCKIWCGTAGSIPRVSGCMTLQGPQDSFTCLSAWRPEWEWRKKRGRNCRKLMSGIQDLTLFYWC